MSIEISLAHRFPGLTLDVAFTAPRGVTALFGRSGSGKTTVVNAVAGLLRPDRGCIRVNGETLLDTDAAIDVPVHRRQIGYVFQDARLFPHLTVRQNLLFGTWFSGRVAARSLLGGIVDLLAIGPLLERRPATLSGGERQRVAIGRALLASPRVLLMDEPLAALDEPRKAEILPYLERLRDEVEIPILYVSHAMAEVARLATTIAVISDGRLVRHGPTADVLSDPGAFPLLGRQEAGSIVAAVVESHDPADGLSELSFSGGRIVVPLVDAEIGAMLRVRIRARDIILALTPPQDMSALNVIAATVRAVGNEDGAIVDVSIRCGETDLLARITRRSLGRLGLAPGVACYAILKSVAVARRDIGRLDSRTM